MNIIKNIFLSIVLCVVGTSTIYTSYISGAVGGAASGALLAGCLLVSPTVVGVSVYHWIEARQRYNKASALLQESPFNKDINNRSLSYIQGLIKDETQMALYLHQMAQYNGALHDKQSANEDIGSAKSWIKWGLLFTTVGAAMLCVGWNAPPRPADDRPDVAPQ